MLNKQKQTNKLTLFYVDLCLLSSYDSCVKKITIIIYIKLII